MAAVTDYVSQNFPAFEGLMGIPDIADLMTRAQAENWTSTRLQAELLNTNWWKQTPETARTWQVKKLTDPASASQSTLNVGNQIANLATGMGINITLPQVAWLSEVANAQGWDAATMKQQVELLANQDKLTAGSITATQTSLRGISAAYGVPVSDATTLDWSKRIAAGNTDESSFTEYAKQQAAISHPYWQKQINEGLTVRQLADPYIQNAARLLEIAPDRVDLSDPKWSFATHNKDGSYVPMSQTDWNRKLMSDPAYGYDRTSNAHEAAFQMIDQLKQSFGAS